MNQKSDKGKKLMEETMKIIQQITMIIKRRVSGIDHKNMFHQ